MANQITPNPSVPTQVVAGVKFPKFVTNLGIIPTSYKDSMSYYECLAWLCKFLEETVIPTVNENGEAVEELQNLYIELNSYVTNYFDNLDVQEEINNKLDDMVEQGTLQEIIADYLNSKALFGYDTVAEMKSATNLISGSYARTLGYHEKNDGGGAIYKIVESQPSNYYETLDSNLYAELIIENYANPKQYGAYGDGTHDDTLSINNCLINKNIIFTKGTYLISDTLDISSNSIIDFNDSTILRKSNNIFDIINIEEQTNVILKNGIIDGHAVEDDLSMENAEDRFSGIYINDSTYCKLENITVKNTCNAEIQIEGTKAGIMIYNSEYIDILNCDVINNLGSGIMLYGLSKYCNINNGYGIGNYGSAITGKSENLTVTNFTALSNGYTGISLNGKYNIATNCVSNNNGLGNEWVSGNYSGFTLGHEENESEGSSLINCIAKNNTLDGISNGGGINVKIIGCTLENNGRSGIYSGHISGSARQLQPTISNCIIKNNTSYGIYILDGSNALINSNTIKGSFPVSVVSAYAKINSNIIECTLESSSNLFYCIYLDGATVDIENNKLVSNLSASSTNGRSIVAVNNASSGNIINNNFINFYYLYYETVKGSFNFETMPKDITILANEDSSTPLNVSRTSNNYIMISYNQGASKTLTYNLPSDFQFVGSYSFIGTSSATASYSASTHVITFTTTAYSTYSILGKATLPFIRTL